jgi:hypothetical protein
VTSPDPQPPRNWPEIWYHTDVRTGVRCSDSEVSVWRYRQCIHTDIVKITLRLSTSHILSVEDMPMSAMDGGPDHAPSSDDEGGDMPMSAMNGGPDHAPSSDEEGGDTSDFATTN